MMQLNVFSYRKVNESFHRRMVYHIGVDCGLFVEMNYMILPQHPITDALSSRGEGISTQGFQS